MWAGVRIKETEFPGIIAFLAFLYPLIENVIQFDAD
jgi:hypothetical protein